MLCAPVHLKELTGLSRIGFTSGGSVGVHTKLVETASTEIAGVH